MPIVEFEVWLGKIKLGTVELNEAGTAWKFTHQLSGTHGVYGMHERRYVSARNCISEVLELLPKPCESLIEIHRNEAGEFVSKCSFGEF